MQLEGPNPSNVTLFETHLTVRDLERANRFYGRLPGLDHAITIESRRVTFYWIGGRGNQMLGLWEVGTAPLQMKGHFAFGCTVDEVRRAPAWLRSLGIEARDLAGNPTEEPVLLAWMPAIAVYFDDPDGNVLEFLAMLPDEEAY